MNPVDIQNRLSEIETDLAMRGTVYGHAAASVARLKRDMELATAKALVAAEGRTADERKANALIAAESTAVGVDYVKALAEYEGLKAVIRTLETRASIGQSLLRSLVLEQNRAPVEPAWSR